MIIVFDFFFPSVEFSVLSLFHSTPHEFELSSRICFPVSDANGVLIKRPQQVQ